MKKTIMLWLFAIVSIVSFAQNTTEHLKFMGIPINGTITQFQSKLLAKGCTLDRASKALPVGCRIFNGKFVGNKVEIYVYYDEKTKVVYRAKAVIVGTSENIADQKYNEIKNMLLQKYGTTWCIEGTHDKKESVSRLVPCSTFNPLDIDPDANIGLSPASYGFKGEIDVFITKDEDVLSMPYNYNVHIDYQDAINGEKHNNQNLEDL